MNKTIWIYWDAGIENAPEIVQWCVKSWKYHNPSWKINVLDSNDVKDIMPLKEKAAFSDILRIKLLEEHGGLWVDATTFCNKPLDDWLENYARNSFFAFSDPQPAYKICSWFLYGEKNNSLITKWKHAVDNYWSGRSSYHDYYWFHILFNELYATDAGVRNIWNAVPRYKANWKPLAEFPSNPHYFAPYTPTRLSNLKIDDLTAPVYKLRWGSSKLLLTNPLIKKLIGTIL